MVDAAIDYDWSIIYIAGAEQFGVALLGCNIVKINVLQVVQ